MFVDPHCENFAFLDTPTIVHNSVLFTNFLVDMARTKQTAKKSKGGEAARVQLNVPLQEERIIQVGLMEVCDAGEHNDVRFEHLFT